MGSDLKQTIAIRKGQCVWIEFAMRIERVKVVGVFEQQGAKLVKYRRPWWDGFFYGRIERLEEFYKRMVK